MTGGGGSLVGAHYYSQEAIRQQVGEDLLLPSSGYEEEWKTLQKRISDINDYKNLDPYFKHANDTFPSSKGDEARDFCSSVIDWNFKSLVVPEKTNLLKNFLQYCVYRIRDNLGSDKLLSTSLVNNPDETTYKSKLAELTNHNEATYGKLNTDLKQIKDKDPKDDSSDWKKLVDWCKVAYEKPYRKNDESFKLANKYCKKNS